MKNKVLQKMVVGSAILSALAGGSYAGDYYLDESIVIANDVVTKSEYAEIKPEVINGFDIKIIDSLWLWTEAGAKWSSVASKEMKECLGEDKYSDLLKDSDNINVPEVLNIINEDIKDKCL